ncbi:MAG TPA: chromosomal replication initiator protein DnaA [Blastocatellia bacterium]|nr:chromosomal replication initiator protein DnaA [Blastocatellia bacterium]
MATNIRESLLSAIEKRVNHQSFTTWFLPLVFQDVKDNTIIIEAPNSMFRDWIMDNYLETIEESLQELNLSHYKVKLTTRGESEVNGVLLQTEPPPESPGGNGETKFSLETEEFVRPIARFVDIEPVELPLNPKYTFDTFVVGSSNQFAHAAAMAVAESPSKAYNPLYIYGGVGLGKTHLMHAIGHAIRARNKHLRLTYISSERFMNELINSIRYDKTLAFREKYRNIDVLLIDDIQFLAGKERTQEEFFHTFNALYDAQKQIVITSDCPPREIPTLEERLHSRFEWGLIADIQPPDLETKVAILKRKAEQEKINLPDSVALFIASKIKSNIRELEGALVRLIAYSSLTGLPMSISLAQETLRGIIDEDDKAITIELIQKTVADYYGLRVSDLKSKNNSRSIAVPRQIAMYLCKRMTKASLPEIGREFGGKHHTTVLHSINKISELYEQKEDFHRIINSLIDRLR